MVIEITEKEITDKLLVDAGKLFLTPTQYIKFFIMNSEVPPPGKIIVSVPVPSVRPQKKPNGNFVSSWNK